MGASSAADGSVMAKRDYYEVLGVPRSATAEELKRAPHKARRFHQLHAAFQESKSFRVEAFKDSFHSIGNKPIEMVILKITVDRSLTPTGKEHRSLRIDLESALTEGRGHKNRRAPSNYRVRSPRITASGGELRC